MTPDRDRARHTPQQGDVAHRRRAMPPLVVHLGTLVVAGAFLLRLNRNQWFFGDEWDFLVERGLLGSRFGLFAPHNEHWSTIPIVLYRATVCAFGLDSYRPFAFLVIGMHLLSAHLLWRLCSRMGADVWITTAVVAGFLVADAGHENLLWAFQVGFVGSLAFGIGLDLVVLSDRESLRRLGLAAFTLGVASLASSGIGVSMVAGGVLLAARRRGLRWACLLGGSLAATFLLWLVTFGSSVIDSGERGRGALSSVPRYVATGVEAALAGIGGGSGGSVVGVGLAAGIGLVMARRHFRAWPALLAASPGLFLLVIAGVGRVGHLGVEQARASRYVYLVCALLVPLIAVVLTDVGPRKPMLALTVLGVILFVSQATQDLESIAGNESVFEQRLRAQILGAVPLLESDVQLLGPHPDPVYSPNLGVGSLAALVRTGRLTPRPVPISAQLAAQSYLTVAGSDSRPGIGPTQVLEISPSDPRCAPGLNEVVLPLPRDRAMGLDFAVETANGRAWLALEAADGTRQEVAREFTYTTPALWIQVRSPLAARVVVAGNGLHLRCSP